MFWRIPKRELSLLCLPLQAALGAENPEKGVESYIIIENVPPFSKRIPKRELSFSPHLRGAKVARENPEKGVEDPATDEPIDDELRIPKRELS